MSIIMFLRRLIRVLRADTAPHQIGLGLALGILAGLPPFGLASVAFIFLFVVLNANLGAFVSAFVVGSLLRVALTAPLVMLGRAVLDAEPLRGFWSWLLNLPVVSLAGFDLYLRFGATLAAIAAGAVLFVLSLLLVTPLRVAISRRVEASTRLKKTAEMPVLSFLGRLLFGKRKARLADIKGGGWIRKGVVLPLLVGLVVAVVGWLVFGPAVTRKSIEMMASLTTGKDFQVSGARLSFLGGSLGVAEIDVREREVDVEPEIADGRKMRLDLSPLSVLDKRLVVDEAAIENLKIFGAKKRAPGEGGEAPSVPVPPMPPEKKEGDPIGLLDIYEWVEAHEKQMSWMLDRVADLLEPKPPAPPGKAKDEFGMQRATWLAQVDERPFFVAKSLAVRNLVFDWRDEKGLHTALERLDLSVDGLSSNPPKHGEPIRFGAEGAWAGHGITLEGILDARASSTENDSLKIDLAAPTFQAARRLGIPEGEGLQLQIQLGFDHAARVLTGAQCVGGFKSSLLGDVKFQLDGVDGRSFDVQISDLDLAAAKAFKRPGALRVDQGRLGLHLRLGEKNGALDGGLEIVANKLQLAPGSARELGGISSDLLCDGLNAVTAEQPLALRFQIGGTMSSPRLSMDDEALVSVLEAAKAGLISQGRARLAAEIDSRLGPLQDLVGKQAGRAEKLLEDPTKILDDPGKLLEDPGKLLEDPGAILDDGKVDVEKAENAAKRLGDQLEGSLGGLLGGKKKDDDKKKDKKPEGEKKKKTKKDKKKDGK